MCPDGQTTLALWSLPRACHSPGKRCGIPRDFATQTIVVMSRDAGDAGDVGNVGKETTEICGMGSSVPSVRKGKQTLYIKAHLSILSEISLSERKLLPRIHSHHTLSYVPTRPNALDRQLKPVTLLVMTLHFLMEREPRDPRGGHWPATSTTPVAEQSRVRQLGAWDAIVWDRP